MARTHPHLVTAAFALFCAVLPAHAEDTGPKRPSLFHLDPAVDGPIIAVSLAIWITPALLRNEFTFERWPLYDEARLNPLDRTVVGNDSHGARLASDIGVAVIPASAAFLSLVHLAPFGWQGVGEDVVLLSEALTLCGMTQQLVRHAIGRPRPYMYDEALSGTGALDGEDHLSFFSGHTAAAFAAATAFATLFSLRSENPTAKALVWAAAVALGATVGGLRVAAGRHFWTDAAVGAVVGTGFGIAVPMLHRRQSGSNSRLQASADSVTWSMSF